MSLWEPLVQQELSFVGWMIFVACWIFFLIFAVFFFCNFSFIGAAFMVGTQNIKERYKKTCNILIFLTFMSLLNQSLITSLVSLNDSLTKNEVRMNNYLIKFPRRYYANSTTSFCFNILYELFSNK